MVVMHGGIIADVCIVGNGWSQEQQLDEARKEPTEVARRGGHRVSSVAAMILVTTEEYGTSATKVVRRATICITRRR